MSFAECSIHDYRCALLQVKVASTLKNPAIRFHETEPHQSAPIPLKGKRCAEPHLPTAGGAPRNAYVRKMLIFLRPEAVRCWKNAFSLDASPEGRFGYVLESWM